MSESIITSGSKRYCGRHAEVRAYACSLSPQSRMQQAGWSPQQRISLAKLYARLATTWLTTLCP